MAGNKFNAKGKVVGSKKNKKVNNAVKQIMNSQRELKNFTLAASYVDVVTGTRNGISSGVVQGDAITGRSGDRIEPVRLQVNLTMLAGIGSTQSFHRVLIFQDRLNQGTLPALSEILDSSQWDSTYNIRNKQQGRFHIMYDKIHGVVGGSNSAATHIQLKLKCKGHISYNGSTPAGGASSDNGPGAIFIFSLTDSVAVSTATVSYYASLFYHDS